MICCARCGAPVEPPVSEADSICAPFADLIGGCCPPGRRICIECVDLHLREIVRMIDQANSLYPVDPVDEPLPEEST